MTERWCVQYRGNGHYFQTREELDTYCRSRGWYRRMSKRFDSSAFRKAMPDLADRFMKESASRRFVIA